MNKINWDEFEDVEEEEEEKKPQNVESPKLKIGEPPMKTHEMFDWEQFPDEEEIEQEEEPEKAKKDKIYQQYAAQNKTPEEIKKLSASERREYAKDLKREREYLQSAGFSKSLLSSATLGATEKSELLTPHEHELLSGLGSFVGSVLPYGAIGKAIKYPIDALKNLIKIGGFGKGALNTAGAALTGATAQTGKQAIKGEGFDIGEIAKEAALFGGLDAVFRGVPAAKKWFDSLDQGKKAAYLESQLTGGNLPKSTYETAEKALRELQQTPSPRLERELPTNQQPQGRQLAGRVTPGISQTQARPIAHTPLELEEQISSILSPNRYRNSAEGGVANVQEIRNLDQQVYRGVQQLYNRSRELNEGVETIHPQLDGFVNNIIQDIERIPEPSDIQRRLLRAATNIRNSLAQRGPNGEVIRYLPINNQALIDQVQSLRSIVDYDFAHGGAKNIFRPLIGEIQQSVINGAEQVGNQAAVQANQEARQAYAQWAQTFDNDYIRPFRDTSNHDYTKLFEKVKDPDNFNQISHVLELSPRGQELARANRASIAESKLSKFAKDPRGANQREFNQSLRDLEAVEGITEENITNIRNTFNNAKRTPNFRGSHRQPTTAELSSAKYLKKTPENIQSAFNSRSGIKELKTDLERTETGRKLFDTLSRQKIRTILREGNIEKTFKGEELYNFLNKEKNFEILSELIGEEATESARITAKEIGKKQVNIDNLKKLGKAAGAIKFLHTIHPLII